VPGVLTHLSDIAVGVVGSLDQLEPGGVEGPVEGEALRFGQRRLVESAEALLDSLDGTEAAVLGDVAP
jgi:hypothetical protein